MKITFCGAAREVTGSCYFVETTKAKFLVDCGLFQGGMVADEKNEADFPFKAKDLDFVLLTHAHLDHSGRLPLLHKRGFRGKIYTTHPSIDLTKIILEDSVNLINEEAERENIKPLYQITDLVGIEHSFIGSHYRKPKTVKGVSFEFFDAGHILGSAQIKIIADGHTIVFSGDLGNPPVPLLRPTEFIDSADYVVMESTYGNKRHEDFHLRKSRLISAISKSISKNGTLLIPAFAIERAQEILTQINEVVEKGGLPHFPMFLDSPMAIKATEVFKLYPDYYNQESLHNLTKDDDLFSFPGLKLTYTSDQSKKINSVHPPKVILAGSGMMHGGRILHHLRHNIENSNTTILIVGFVVENSLGRRLLEGDKSVKIFGQPYKVKAQVEAIGAFSSHADQPKLLEWLDHFTHKPKKIFITHGEVNSALDFSESVKSTMGIATEVPELFANYDLS